MWWREGGRWDEEGLVLVKSVHGFRSEWWELEEMDYYGFDSVVATNVYSSNCVGCECICMTHAREIRV